ncbi:MAG TPA: SDR family NAD(P)-dependent oxidoreductase, partial [Myxococcaceae bacterium]|nr:SDR family NAD(P)-dependent oxidoreductase [Myxococcaceae bacterium]
MDFGIGGKVALVTAGSRGIGFGIAQALAAEGARVAVVAREESGVQQAARAVGGFGYAADLLTVDGCSSAVAAVQDALGPVEILVNNLG